jgi:hypothetical protein
MPEERSLRPLCRVSTIAGSGGDPPNKGLGLHQDSDKRLTLGWRGSPWSPSWQEAHPCSEGLLGWVPYLWDLCLHQASHHIGLILGVSPWWGCWQDKAASRVANKVSTGNLRMKAEKTPRPTTCKVLGSGAQGRLIGGGLAARQRCKSSGLSLTDRVC